MTAARITMFVAGGALLTAWLVVAATARVRPTPPAPQAERQAGTDPAAADLQEQTRRLRAGIETAPTPRVTDRNPFAFARVRTKEATPVAPPTTALPPPAPIESPPVLRLVGIAADGSTRTAAISADGEVVLVRVGDAVAGRYRVAAITADVVELADERGGPAIRLGLR